MRILIVHDYGYVIGGAEVVVQSNKAALELAGHTVAILAGTPTTHEGAFNDYAFDASDATPFGKLANHLYNPRAAWQLRRVVVAFNPDVIHLHTVVRASPVAIWTAIQLRPSVMTLHDYGLLYPKLHRTLDRRDFCGLGDNACCARHAGFVRYGFEHLRTSLASYASRNLSAYLAPSVYVQGLAQSLGLNPAIVIENSVELLTPTPGDGQTVLYTGRLEPEKGVSELLYAFALVLESMPQAKLRIIGNGSLRVSLERQAAELGSARSVTFEGHADRNTVSAAYAGASLLAVPSLWAEPFGLNGPEAMSAGRPVVGSGRGGMRQWLSPGVNGIVADPTDTRGFAGALLDVLQNHALYHTLSDGAVRTAARFGPKVHAEALVAAYATAIAR